MKWKQKDKKKVMTAFKKILKELRIWPCQIDYFFIGEQDPSSEETDVKLTYSFPYEKYVMTMYPNLIDGDDAQISLSLWHEAFHILLLPLTQNRLMADEIFREHEEQVVEQLTNCCSFNVTE